MGLFGKEPTTLEAAAEQIAATLERRVTESVQAALADLTGGHDASAAVIRTKAELLEVEKKLSDLQISYDREQEKHARTTREIEHKVGLHKKQVEAEIAHAKREVELTVRSENLDADRKRFEQEIEFTRDQFEKQVGYLQGMMKEVLNRLPEVKVERTYTTNENIGDPPPAPKRKALSAAK